MREARLVDVLGETGSIKTGPFGTVLQASEYTSQGHPVISVGEVGRGRIQLTARTPHVGSATAARLPEYVLAPDDIVFARKGAVDRSALVRPDEAGYFLGSDGIRVRLRSDVNATFVAYQMQWSSTREWLLRHASGSTMLSLNQRTLEHVPLLLPEPATQEAIAEVLGALDDKIAANDRMCATLHALMAAEFTALVQSASESVLLSEVVKLEYGKALPAVRRRKGIVPVYGSGGVGGYHDEPLRSGPGVIVGRKGTVGSVYWSQSDFFAIDTTYFVSTVPAGPGLPYLYFALRSMGLDERNSDSAVPGLNRDAAYRIPTPLADGRAREHFEERATAAFNLMDAKERESRSLSELRDTLLPALMSGRLSVKDATDAVESSTTPSLPPTEASQS